MDAFDSICLFPVFFFLFVVYQIKHPLRGNKYILLLFVPYALMVTTSLYGWVNSLTTDTLLPSGLEALVEAVSILGQLFAMFLFAPGLLLYTFFVTRHSSIRAERQWMGQLSLFLFIFTVLLIVGLFAGAFIEALNGKDYVNRILIGFVLILSLFIHWLAYNGIFKLKLAQDQTSIKDLLRQKENVSIRQEVKPDVPAKKPVAENEHFTRLEELCVDDHIYRDNTLDREKVAQLLGVSPGYVSQIVKSGSGVNFATYINQYRVEEVKKHIIDDAFDQYSLLAIGYESGFSSKTTFHNAFKKMTGLTPNAYRKEHK